MFFVPQIQALKEVEVVWILPRVQVHCVSELEERDTSKVHSLVSGKYSSMYPNPTLGAFQC